MSRAHVEYIKSHIESDLQLNRAMSGRDYSGALAGALQAYLDLVNTGVSENALVVRSMTSLSHIERDLGQKTGKIVSFLETMKCVIPLYQMKQEGDTEGLDEIRRYADELLTRALG